ncbi:MAG TPA: carboxypeptidase-like regulatory domain-containing protein, partial [Saprospiraceae bacterium]|nr:carboxypeptidase-like regulatory domain-containing protein [Saprospiraceae bacterium]
MPLLLSAQKGSISGKIIDGKYADALIGASVRLSDGSGGAITDLDGHFVINNLNPGTFSILINYTGYAPKTIEHIVVKANEVTVVDITLEEPSTSTISEVVVVATAAKSSQSALTILQKTSATIGDGISA